MRWRIASKRCIRKRAIRFRQPLQWMACGISIMRCSSAIRTGNNLEARTEMLLGSHLAGLSLASVSMGLHHGLCHVLGGTANVPHGIANSIILPHAIRFNADATATQLLPAAAGDGRSRRRNQSEGSHRSAGAENLRPHPQNESPAASARCRSGRNPICRDLAEIAFPNRTVQNNPKPITDVTQLEEIASRGLVKGGEHANWSGESLSRMMIG